ncbi:MAG: DUF4442 domain-containing protein [Bacteroidales bacterium]|nr:MAG: DUF4442 domain-containing protein [Bacteroidales bacterium]
MNVLEIPFNKFLGLEYADSESNFILKLDCKAEYLNHLGTIHASVLFALAESSSGEFLLKKFIDLKLEFIPVVRKVEVKYSRPAMGTVFSRAYLIDSNPEEILNELTTRKRVIIKVGVDIYNSNTEKVLTSFFDWFISSI